MGLPATGRPIVKTIRIRETLKPEEYRYLKVNFLRLHRQFAMPNTRRYHYDFFLICFGPMPLPERVALGERATAAIGLDGSYRAVPIPTGAVRRRWRPPNEPRRYPQGDLALRRRRLVRHPLSP